MENTTDFSLEDWAARYEKAQADGVFKDSPSPIPSAQKASDSFFGASNLNSTDVQQINEEDAKLWRHVAKIADVHSFKAPLMTEGNSRLTDKELGDHASKIATSVNPIEPSSVGTDQEIEPASVGLTFTPEDINDLAELKLNLFNLENDFATFEARGKNSDKFKKQIDEVKAKIKQLSELMNKSFTIEER